MILLPGKTRQWTQPNTGDVTGVLLATKNINFDQKGYAKLARRSSAIVYQTSSNYPDVVSISTGLATGTYYAMTGNRPYSFNLTGSAITDLSNTGHIGSVKFDGLIWQGLWYVTQDTSFSTFDGATTWVTGLGSLTTGTYHPMCIHEGLNLLAIGDGNQILLYNSSNTLSETVTIPAQFEVRWIRYNANTLYVGTKNTIGGSASVFTINDVTSSATSGQYVVPNSFHVFSGCIYDGVLVVISSRGQLLRFNGQGFTELAHLPVYDTSYTWFDGNGFDTGKVAQRGMIARGDKIFINLDGYINSPNYIQLPNQPSGLWCYDAKVGLYHRAGLSNEITSTVNFTSASSASHMITVGTPFTIPTGTKVFVSATDIGGLSNNTFYYIIWLTTTTFRLATSYNNAINGIEIALTSNGSSLTMYYHPDSDFGESLQGGYQSGALAVISELDTTVSTYREYYASQLLFGAATVDATSGSGVYTIQSLTIGENRGSITTTKIQSASIQDNWTMIYLKYDHAFQGNDKVIVKFRTNLKENYPLLVSSNSTWVTSTSFTSAFDWSQASIGNEISITAGRGAGCLAHIVSLTNNAGTWTVVVDEAIPNVTAGDISVYMIVENWIKATTGGANEVANAIKNSLDADSSKWIQLKFEVRGVSDPYIEEIQLINSTQEPSI